MEGRGEKRKYGRDEWSEGEVRALCPYSRNWKQARDKPTVSAFQNTFRYCRENDLGSENWTGAFPHIIPQKTGFAYISECAESCSLIQNIQPLVDIFNISMEFIQEMWSFNMKNISTYSKCSYSVRVINFNVVVWWFDNMSTKHKKKQQVSPTVRWSRDTPKTFFEKLSSKNNPLVSLIFTLQVAGLAAPSDHFIMQIHPVRL